jgi:hypothetical protein
MMKKKFIHRRCIYKVLRSSLVRSPKVGVVAASSSGRSLSSSSLLSSLTVEKVPLIRTSTPVLPLQKKEGLVAAPVVNFVPISLVDATSARADLIVLSSDSDDEVDWEALVVEDEVDWEVLVVEDDDDIESVGSGSPMRN